MRGTYLAVVVAVLVLTIGCGKPVTEQDLSLDNEMGREAVQQALEAANPGPRTTSAPLVSVPLVSPYPVASSVPVNSQGFAPNSYPAPTFVPQTLVCNSQGEHLGTYFDSSILPHPSEGHGSGTSSNGYDIWRSNCHTAANVFTLENPNNSGALICRGNPQNQSEPRFHTASWRIYPEHGVTCIFNWGTPCCWAGVQNPPDISRGRALQCAQQACGRQYCNETRCHGAGQLVEIPGDAACVRQVGLNGTVAQCKSCCDARADMWDPTQWGIRYQFEFRRRCKDLCESMIGNTPVNTGCMLNLGSICGNSRGNYGYPNCCRKGQCVPMNNGTNLKHCQ